LRAHARSIIALYGHTLRGHILYFNPACWTDRPGTEEEWRRITQECLQEWIRELFSRDLFPPPAPADGMDVDRDNAV